MRKNIDSNKIKCAQRFHLVERSQIINGRIVDLKVVGIVVRLLHWWQVEIVTRRDLFELFLETIEIYDECDNFLFLGEFFRFHVGEKVDGEGA